MTTCAVIAEHTKLSKIVDSFDPQYEVLTNHTCVSSFRLASEIGGKV